MRLLLLEVQHFRNIVSPPLAFGGGLNLILGRNGQGKTNLVEAIVFLSWLKSFRTSRSADLVQSSKEQAFVRAEIENLEGRHEISVVLGRGYRKVMIDGHAVRTMAECMRHLTVVFLSADDPAVLEGGPEGRRVLVDRAVVILDSQMEQVYARYQRLLKERNALLRQVAEGHVNEQLLTACEEALAEAGAKIAQARVEVLGRLTPLLQRIFSEVVGEELRVDIMYAPRWAEKGEWKMGLLEALHKKRAQDVSLGFTSVGPHADDVSFYLLNLPAKGHISRGQRKTIMLAWKAAESRLVSMSRGEEPVLVLDDAFSDLDEQRQILLARWLASFPGQTFLTATRAPCVPEGLAIRILFAEKGTFSCV